MLFSMVEKRIRSAYVSSLLPPPIPPRPDAALARREDAVRIERILDLLVQAPRGVVVPVVGRGHEVHEGDVGAVLAVALLARVLDQRTEHPLDPADHLRVVLVEE